MWSSSAGSPGGKSALRGLETVTYMIDGIFEHQDANAGGGLITDRETQWVTAGVSCRFASR
jgi:redox-sensitive bicupin YhaK (pirin superfamily)